MKSEYSEDEFLALSGIQHYAFCPRQWALIHIEQQWEENILTVEGEILHERVHDSLLKEKRGTKRYVRGMAVHSRTLGIYGVCDMVELSDGEIIPVEYKRGKPKEHNVDKLQLALQSICLEEMMCQNISYGYIFYNEIKHREFVEISSELKEEVSELVKEMHSLYERGHTPKQKKEKHCSACSLKEICLPKISRQKSPEKYIDNAIKEIDL